MLRLLRLGAAHATELQYVWGNLAAGPKDPTFKMGGLSIEALRDAAAGKQLPKVTDTGVLFVGKDNVGSYMEEMKKEFAGK